jgi:IPT/TIG domain/Glucose / Sorbosone dehydrogenase
LKYFFCAYFSLGIAIDPLDTKANPDVYFTMNGFFHYGRENTAGPSVAGRIRRASGPNLETIVDIITGLPVSGTDHGLNAIEFLDNGALLFTCGSQTNGGLPGKLSNSGVLKENFLSASVGIAYLSHPSFSGTIKWSAPDDGNMISTGIDLFAIGLRNPFGLVLHTNGKVYATDNGPNIDYGRMLTDCNGDSIDNQSRDDEINLLEKGKYYGSPNLKRAAYFNDPRQCVWRGPEEVDSYEHTAPLLTHASSIDGILEFHGNHFGGQLRYNLIYLRYKDSNNFFRVVLTPDGRALLPSLNKRGISMNIGNLGLDLTQAPNGNLIEMRYNTSNVHYYKPLEPATTELIAKTCWPRRGRTSGGTPLTIYGENFNARSSTVTVTVGGTNCPVTSVSVTKVVCTLPGGVGTVDIVVKNGDASSTFEKGYRYISGVLPPSFQIPVYTG